MDIDLVLALFAGAVLLISAFSTLLRRAGLPGSVLTVATGVLWTALGVPFLLALLLGAVLTPTDPVVTTPIVTRSPAEERIPERVRHSLSAESGINDGLACLFVLLSVLLMTEPDRARHELLTRVLLREVLGAAALGALLGFLLGRLFVLVRRHGLMEESSYLAFVVPLALGVLGTGKLLGTGALPAERHTGDHRIFDDATLAITLSGLVHGLSTAPMSAWLHYREPARAPEEETIA